MTLPLSTAQLEETPDGSGDAPVEEGQLIYEVLGLAQVDPSSAAAAAPRVADDVPFYTAEDGVLIMESESMKSEGSWQERIVDGETVMLWDHSKSHYGKVDPDEELTAAFTVDKDGTFSISTHGGRVKSAMRDSELYDSSGNPRGDTGNDAYIAIRNLETGEYVKEPTKLFVGLGQSDQELRWGDTFENHDIGFHPSRVELEQGVTYQIEITGRSDGYALDRVTINHGFHDLNDEDTPESSFVLGSAVPVDPVDPDDGDDPVDPVDPDDGDVVADAVGTGESGSGDGDDDDGIMAVLALGLGAGLVFLAGPLLGVAGGLGALLLGSSGGGSSSATTSASVLSSVPEEEPGDEVLLSEIIPATEILSEDAPEPFDEEETELDALA